MIGVFDSGLGGLGVAVEVRRLLPDADIVYVGDRERSPYGKRRLDEVRRFSEEVTAHLISRGCDTIVVACNTASAAALHHLRRAYPATTFVGMEPAVKPAAAASTTGVIAVLATAATFQSELFDSVVDRFATGVQVIRHVCDNWVAAVEAGLFDDDSTRETVARDLAPLLEQNVDALVLGCTHYPFLRHLIEEVAGPSISIIDPAQAVARQTARVASSHGSGDLTVEVTGGLDGVSQLVNTLVGLALPTSAVTFRR